MTLVFVSLIFTSSPRSPPIFVFYSALSAIFGTFGDKKICIKKKDFFYFFIEDMLHELLNPDVLYPVLEFLSPGSDLPLRLTSRSLRDGIKECQPSSISVPHDFLCSEAILDWAVNKMRMPTNKLCGIKLGGVYGDRYVDADILLVAAKYGKLAGIDWIFKGGYTGDSSATQVAVKYGQVEAIKRLRAHGFVWDEFTCNHAADAAYYGQVPMLRYLLNEANPPCPIDSRATEYAARQGHLGVLQFLRQEAKTQSTTELWGESICQNAVMCQDHAQSVKILQWLREVADPPVPWGQSCSQAAHEGNLLALQYTRLIANPPCNWARAWCLHWATSNKSFPNGHPHVVQWIHSQPDNDGDSSYQPYFISSDDE
jgi:hypothetical protein